MGRSRFSYLLAGAIACPLGLFLHSLALAQTHPLNDTGQITCYNASASTGNVSAGNPDPEQAGFNEQDCTQGRAAADSVGVLYKVGGSTRPGADYTRIANDGSVLPANAALGSGPGDWACTRDNATGLVWEVKVNNSAHLRNWDYRYTWFEPNPAINGGDPGTPGGSTSSCGNTLSSCNTAAFRDAVNAVGLCGASDWRLPSVDELQSLMHYGVASGARIDTTWFPNTFVDFYWSGQNYAPNTSSAWIVDFSFGGLGGISKGSLRRVRLVRGGQ